jgi:hypothetical protein
MIGGGSTGKMTLTFGAKRARRLLAGGRDGKGCKVLARRRDRRHNRNRMASGDTERRLIQWTDYDVA